MNIYYDPLWKNIAISLSGGADSALLAYMICDASKENKAVIHIINHVRCWKTKPWQQHNVNCVCDWLFQRFNHTEFIRHTNFIAPELEYSNIGAFLTDEYGKKVSGDNIQQRAYAEYICNLHNVDAYYNGVTCNPSPSQFNGMKERDIEPCDENKYLEKMQHMQRWALHPFRFINKSEIVKKYIDLNIMDLFDITRSCEGVFSDLDYTTYASGQNVPICGKCFWCKEREWALNNVD